MSYGSNHLLLNTGRYADATNKSADLLRPAAFGFKPRHEPARYEEIWPGRFVYRFSLCQILGKDAVTAIT